MTEFIENVRTSAAEMRGLFPATPLQLNDFLSSRYGAKIYLKCEDLSPVRSYKIRGAFNAMRKEIAARKTELFVCASAGNHAQGVAYACQYFGVHGAIFMPVTTPQQKIEKTTVFGGDAIEIQLVGDYFDVTLSAARDYCERMDAHFLSPFDDSDVIEGQASVALEILEQMPDPPDLVVLPVGGGGLSSGMKRFFSNTAPQIELSLVEPQGGASLMAALKAKKPVILGNLDTFVDGAAVARIGERNFYILQDVPLSSVHAVPEDRICGTILEMLNHEGIVLEPAGALAVDLLADIADQIAGKSMVVVTSGGNFDFERLPEVKERAQRYAGLKKYFILRMPQRPGALRDFLEMLGPHDDIARFEYLKKSARNFGTVLIGIETRAPENFERLFARLDEKGFSYTDVTENESVAEFIL